MAQSRIGVGSGSDAAVAAGVTQGSGSDGSGDGWCRPLQRRRLRTQTGAAAQGS